MSIENPPLLEHGFVEGRFVSAVASALETEGRQPDWRPMTGYVRLVPLQDIHLKGGVIPTTVGQQPVQLDLNPQGYVVDAESAEDLSLKPGAKLPVGQYRVEFFLDHAPMAGYVIEVKPEHTKDNPLNLTDAAPLTPPPGFIEVVRLIDRDRAEAAAEAAEGHVATLLALIEDFEPGGGGAVNWSSIQGKPEEFPPAPHAHSEYLTAEDLQEFSLVGHTHPEYLTADDLPEFPEVPDLSGLVTTDDPRLTDARTPLEHSHSVSEVDGLEGRLNALQEAVDTQAAPPSWEDVTGKPTEFPPAEHEHPGYLTEGDLPEPPAQTVFGGRIFIQSSPPSNPQAGDIHLW